MLLLLTLILTACRSVPAEVLDKQRELEEAKKNNTSFELEKDSIENIYKTSNGYVDLDLGTVHLKGSVRVPNVKEIPVLTLERNKKNWDEFEKFVTCVVPAKEVNPENIKIDAQYGSKEYNYKNYRITARAGDYGFGISGNRFEKPFTYAGFEKADTIFLYRGESVDPRQTYRMNGEDVKLQTVLDYVNNFISQEAFGMRPGYTLQVRTLFPRLLDDGENYGVEFLIESCYKGVPFDSIFGYANNNWMANQNTSRESEFALIFVSDNKCERIDEMISPVATYNVLKETPTDNRFLTLEAAFMQLKNTLTDDSVFDDFSCAELAYDIRYPGHYNYEAEKEEKVKEFTASPVWLFMIDKAPRSGIDGHDVRKTFIVDAITGDVSVYDENTYY